MNRRHLLKYSALGGLAVITGTAFSLSAQCAQAEDLPHVSKDDPMAKALKYSEDAAQSERKNADAFCHSCRFFKGTAGADAPWAPCELFPGKSVNRNGWCSM